MTLPVVRLHWLDSCHHNTRSWVGLSDLEFNRAFLEYTTVGYLLKETDWSYVLIQSIGVDPQKQDHVDGVMEIPKCAVSKMERLCDA